MKKVVREVKHLHSVRGFSDAHTGDMAETAFVDPGLSKSPLVSVSFQKNEQRNLMFLQGEPKVLGLTQICLIIFHTSCSVVFYFSGLHSYYVVMPFFISSFFTFTAGSLAIAAKNLHLPTLKACLGMEIAASVASVLNLIITLLQMESRNYICKYYYYDDYPNYVKQTCKDGEAAHLYIFAGLVIIQVVLFTIAVTLVVYASKVANCSSPTPKVAVITI